MFALVVAFMAFLVSFGTTAIATAWARRHGAIEPPDPSRRIHEFPTPRVGGIGILAGMFVLAVTERPPSFGAAFLFGTSLLFFVGLLDDLWKLPALLKFGLQALSAWAAVHSGRFEFTGEGQGPWPSLFTRGAGPVLTVLWIVAVVNLVNFFDGIDGIVGALAAVVFGAGIGWDTEAGPVFGVALGALLGFAAWNAPRARVFMGDCGSHAVGYLIALGPCLITDRTAGAQWRSMDTLRATMIPWPVVGAALLPAILDVGEALIHKARNRIPLSQAHADHLYQRLVKAGWSHGAVALRYGLLALAGVVLAGPVASGAGLAWALVPGILLLVVHWATGIRATRAVPRLAKTSS